MKRYRAKLSNTCRSTPITRRQQNCWAYTSTRIERKALRPLLNAIDATSLRTRDIRMTTTVAFASLVRTYFLLLPSCYRRGNSDGSADQEGTAMVEDGHCISGMLPPSSGGEGLSRVHTDLPGILQG